MTKQKLSLEVLHGYKHTESVDVELNGNVFEIDIRPLKHTEAAVIQAILSKGVKMDTNSLQTKNQKVSLDMELTVKAQYEAQLEAAAMGTTDEQWTKETIDQYWSSDMIAKVGQQVMNISGIGNPEEVKQFRQEQ